MCHRSWPQAVSLEGAGRPRPPVPQAAALRQKDTVWALAMAVGAGSPGVRLAWASLGGRVPPAPSSQGSLRVSPLSRVRGTHKFEVGQPKALGGSRTELWTSGHCACHWAPAPHTQWLRPGPQAPLLSDLEPVTWDLGCSLPL